ncbi:acyl-CoA synthetase family member 2, mitochondrial [Cephus cinctus]|uniref:Medium-chain acyl-CoA ligase ACSF2, mitochondrial n=1 Tax=Cephus cinctus TaxID=211228 RepID=A0AAJ7BQ54_CEPCN|nr:acyl-CoA synthetase family member 2, mitochondrial [Cephus cinctus]
MLHRNLTVLSVGFRKFLLAQFRVHTEKRWTSSGASIEKDLSYFSHPGRQPLLEMTVGQLFQESAERWPQRECIISMHQNVRLTFSDVLSRVDKLAAGFKKLGLKKGDRIGIWAPNDYQWYLSFVAATRAGIIMVGINPAYQKDEIEYCIQKVGVKAIVCPESSKRQNYAKVLLDIKQRCPTLDHIIVYSQDHVRGTRRFSDVEALASDIEVEAIGKEQSDISPGAGCNIQFTSGTTGKPKAVLLGHKSFVNNSKQAAERTELLSGQQKICLNVPFFHAFGMVQAQLASLHAGSTMVIASPFFNPVTSIETIIREKCTVTFGTPTMWVNLIDVQHRLSAPVETLFSGVIGGSPASPQLFKRIQEHLRLNNMKSIYGLTETCAIIFQSLPGELKEFTENTVGHVSDHIEALVVDDKGSPVAFGHPGELWVRGYTSMIGYWNDEENTRKTITEDGWLKTGDQFILEKNGYGRIVGRLKDMLIRGGENIFPKEVEHFLESHPGIVEAHAFGVYDDVYGEEICACIRTRNGVKLTADDVKAYGRGRVAHFKIPRYIVFVDQLPKTASGKIQKFKLREEVEAKGLVPSKPK